MSLPENRQLEEHQITALIYQVANELQGLKVPDPEAQKTINLIGQLGSKGKLNKMQTNILDGMGQNASMDYDGF